MDINGTYHFVRYSEVCNRLASIGTVESVLCRIDVDVLNSGVSVAL